MRRHQAGGEGAAARQSTPLWQRLVELKMPLLLIYGRNDRAGAEERAKSLKERYPQLDLHFAEGCKHLVPWDAADLFHRLAMPFLPEGAARRKGGSIRTTRSIRSAPTR